MTEVAACLGITPSTAKARAHRARLLLRQHLGEIHAPAHHLASKPTLKVDEIPFRCGAPYFLDACGRACPHHFGEGARDRSEMAIQQLLAEFGVGGPRDDVVSVEAGPAMRRMAFVRVTGRAFTITATTTHDMRVTHEEART